MQRSAPLEELMKELNDGMERSCLGAERWWLKWWRRHPQAVSPGGPAVLEYLNNARSQFSAVFWSDSFSWRLSRHVRSSVLSSCRAPRYSQVTKLVGILHVLSDDQTNPSCPFPRCRRPRTSGTNTSIDSVISGASQAYENGSLKSSSVERNQHNPNFHGMCHILYQTRRT